MKGMGEKTRRALLLAIAVAALIVAALPSTGSATNGPVPAPTGDFTGNLNGCTGTTFSVESVLGLPGPWIGGSSGNWSGDDTVINAGGLVVNVDSAHTHENQLFFHWTSNIPVEVAVVKQGNGGVYWTFDPGQTSGWLASYTALGVPSNGVSHIVFCAKPKLIVEKTAEASVTKTHEWEVTKTADPTEATVAVGDSASTTWKITLDETETIGDWAVSGTISVTNPTGTDTLVSLSDTLAGASVTIEPACTGPFMVTAGSTVDCDYTATYASNPGLGTLTNTATADAANGGILDGQGSVDFSFADAKVTVEGHPSVDLVDDQGGEFDNPYTGDAVVEYEKEYTCREPGTHEIDNTVDVLPAGEDTPVIDTDTATFTLNCSEPKQDLEVEKTAEGSWYRFNSWSVEKTVSPSSHDMDEGESGNSTWTIDVTKATTVWYAVAGTITVTNPNGFEIGGVEIEESFGDNLVDFDCGAWQNGDAIGAGESVNCEYVAVFDNEPPATSVNEVTVTTDDEEIGGETSAQFSFPQDPVIDVNPEITVDDPRFDESWTATDSEDGDEQFVETFTCDSDEGQHVNTVTLYGDNPDTEPVETNHALDSDSATVTVTCNEEPPPPGPPAPKINIGVVKTATPQVALNANATFTLTVTSNGDTAANNVTVSDPAPAGFIHQSASATNGATCEVLQQGALVTCTRPGSFAPGASFVVTIVSKATTTGTHLNTATVATLSPETTYADNTSSAPVLVVAPVTPPKPPKPPVVKPAICANLTVVQKSITVGKKNTLTMTVKAGGKPVKGAKVKIKGPGINKTATTNSKGIAKVTLSPKRAGIITVTVTKPKSCSSARRVGVVGAFEPPVTG